MTFSTQRVALELLRLLEVRGSLHSAIKESCSNGRSSGRIVWDERQLASLVTRIPYRCPDFVATRIHGFSEPSQIGRVGCGLDGERDPKRVAGTGQNRKGVEVAVEKDPRRPRCDLSRGSVGRYYHRGSRWPWISVVPSETPAYTGTVEKGRDITNEVSGPTPNDDGSMQPSESLFPLVHRDPGVGNLLNLLPISVPEKICTLLSKYGWSAHTVLELRTLMAQGTNLKPRHVFDVLSKQRDADIAYNFLQWALNEANCKPHIKCFTIVLLLVGHARKYDLMEKLLDGLNNRGYREDKIIFTAAMASYAEGQRIQEALNLFTKMKERGFKPDCVTYSVLMQMFSKVKLYQEALKLYDEMLAQGVATDTQVYNCVVSTLGKAGRLDLAYKKLDEMRERGHIPDQYTYGVLLEGYAKAGRRDFMDLYREMQSAGVPINEVIFNIMFSGIEHIGTLKDAEGLFADMERLGLSSNLNVFSTLIGMCSKKGDAEGAKRWFDKMTSLGLKPTLAVGNSLLDSYARSKKFGQAKEILNSFQSWGITPNLPTLTVSLRCLSLCKKPEDLKIVHTMLSYHSGSQFLSVLVDRSVKKDLAPVIASFLGSLHFERRQYRRDFVNVLIDYLYKNGFRSQSYRVWEGALANYVFPALVEQGPEGICSVNLRGMECGTAIVALTYTLPRLAKQFHRKEMTPEWVQIYTIHVTEETTTISDPKSVHQSVEMLLQTLHSPFHAGTIQTGGGFVCRGEKVMHWLDEPEIKAMLAFKH